MHVYEVFHIVIHYLLLCFKERVVGVSVTWHTKTSIRIGSHWQKKQIA